MRAPCSTWHVIARYKYTSQGGGLESGMNESSMLPLVCNSKVGETSQGGGLRPWVNETSMLPLACNSKVEHLTG